MSSKFCLLDLHIDTLDVHPRSWICCINIGIKDVVARAEREICVRHNLTRESLSREISSKLRCSLGVVKRILQGDTGQYPIPILLALANMLPRRNRNIFLASIQQHTTQLKVNSASARPVLAVKSLDIQLARIIGAFMADGSLSAQATITTARKAELEKILARHAIQKVIRFSRSRNQYYASIMFHNNILPLLVALAQMRVTVQTHYTLDLVEEFKDSVEAFNRWMHTVFGVSPTMFMRHKNAWRTIFSNKIIARYLMQYFDVVPGSKTFTANVPPVIHAAALSIRKAFARGVLMFDGSVNTVPAITFSTKSKHLWHAVKDIMERDGILTTNHAKNTRNEWTFATRAGIPQGKLASYFEVGTQKYKLLMWMFGDTNEYPVIKTGTRISTEKIFELLPRIGQCDVSFIKKHFRAKDVVVRNLIRILKRQKRVTTTKKPHTLGQYVSDDIAVSLHPRFREKLFLAARTHWGKDAQVCNSIHVDKSTYSAWRRGVNRIPLWALRKIFFITRTEWERITGNIESIDRLVIEALPMKTTARH